MRREIASPSSESGKGEIQMAFANIHVRLHRTEFARPQLQANFANHFSLRRAPGKLNEQAIRELVACLVAVNVGDYHFDRACFVETLNKLSSLTLCCIARGLESS